MRSEITINLSKLDANVNAIRSRLEPGVKIMAVVKDEAYGHGILPIAKHLSKQVEWLCVARLQEGIALRESGIKIPILVFEIPEETHGKIYKEYSLTASISDLSTFEILEEGTEYHSNCDTGMRRLGISPEEYEEVYNKFKEFDKLICTGLYTHFATADEPSSKSVEIQLSRFKKISPKFPNSLMRHTANTGAIFYYQDLDLQFDAVRPGVCLYGYLAGNSESSDLDPIIEWKSHVMQVRKVREGESVSYGEAWVAPKDGYVGTIPLGYSDGIQRLLSGKFQVEINGECIQQVGRISMDYFGVFSESPSFTKGDEVSIFNGANLNPKVWANVLNTIPYEITTSLSQRIERKYLNK